MSVRIVRKAIRNLHLGVYPPDGRVRVAAPKAMSDQAIRLAVVGRLAWIRKQRASFDRQLRQGERQMVSGESHYVFGHRRRLRVTEHDGPAGVILRGRTILELQVRPGSDRGTRERVLTRWYRARLRELLVPIMARWEKRLGVSVSQWGLRKMKTRWGTCNAGSRRVLLNSELAKKAEQCVEYLVLHELVHLKVRHHDDRFVALMDQHMPDWRSRRALLVAQPLGHVTWQY